LKQLKTIWKLLCKKAKWKTLNTKTRGFCSRLLVCAIYCLVVTVGCVAAVVHEVPNVEMFRVLGLSAAMAFTALIFLSLSVNIAGVVISRAERYQRLSPALQKRMKGRLFSRSVAVCAASYRAGHARSHRRARSAFAHASGGGDGSDDGESDSSGDPPRPTYFACSVTPFQVLYLKPNSFPSPWRFLRSPGCWRMRFSPASAGGGWGE
jgi:hypothetical protein